MSKESYLADLDKQICDIKKAVQQASSEDTAIVKKKKKSTTKKKTPTKNHERNLSGADMDSYSSGGILDMMNSGVSYCVGNHSIFLFGFAAISIFFAGDYASI